MPDAREQNFASLDIALDLLRRPTTVHDRLGILQHLVNFWHGPIRPEDGMSDAEVACRYRCRCDGGTAGRENARK